MADVVIRAEGLSKHYRLGRGPKYKNLRESLTGLARHPLRYLRRPTLEMIWALSDVSFSVGRGEVVGVIGHNGAGKSTLLKILSRITEPTAGRAEVTGRVGSLLEVGTGVHSELTGRENIYLNGAILGMRRAEIARKFDEIVAFAEIERFLDTQVKHYSSGMYLRLAFAVAAHMDPEIMLVDEVLAVGDAAFQKKCLGKMEQVAAAGRTVLFVSHNMASIVSLCGRAIRLGSGKLVDDGPAQEVVQRYLQSVATQEIVNLADRRDREGDGSARMTGVRIESLDRDSVIRPTSRLRVSLDYCSDKPLVYAKFLVGVYDLGGKGAFLLDSEATGGLPETLPPVGTVICETEPINLTPGRCFLNLAVIKGAGMADYVQSACYLDVEPDDVFGTGKLPTRSWMLCIVRHSWHLQPSDVNGGSAPAGGHPGQAEAR